MGPDVCTAKEVPLMPSRTVTDRDWEHSGHAGNEESPPVQVEK